MIIGVIIEFMVGLSIIIIGILLWKKRMLSILHEYHYRNVRQKDIPAYTRQIGISLIIIGAGIVITGILNLFYSSLWWIPLLGGFSLGLIMLYITQKKYNGSVLG